MNLMKTLAAESIGEQTRGISGNASAEQGVANLLKVGLGVVGVLAVIIIIIGGIYYMTSQGEAPKITKAKKTIIGGVIGLAVAVLAFAIVQFTLGSM